MAKTTTIEPFGYFICPSCLKKDAEHDSEAFFPVHLEPGKLVGDVKYCELCAGEILDAIAIEVHGKLLHGKVTWGDAHSIAFKKHAGNIFEVIFACPCQHERKTSPFRYYFASFSQYWDFLASIVELHYKDIKAII